MEISASDMKKAGKGKLEREMYKSALRGISVAHNHKIGNRTAYPRSIISRFKGVELEHKSKHMFDCNSSPP